MGTTPFFADFFMNWILLVVAGVFEVAWAVCMKYSCGFTKLLPSIGTVVAMGLSVLLLALALKSLPLGTAYAVWTGIGTLGAAVAGIILWGESVSFWRILCLVMIVSGIIGLKFLTPESGQ